MKRTTRPLQAGFSLLEVCVALVILAMGMTASLAIFNRGSSFVTQASVGLQSDESGRFALATLTDPIQEARLGHIDTSFRVKYSDGTWYQSDRFFFDNLGLSQCLSPLCRYHTRPDLTTRIPEFHCGYEFRSGLGWSPITRGKIWPASMTRCPLDGGWLSNQGPVGMDGVKLFTARAPDGTFTQTPAPRWTGLLFFFPAPKGNREGADLMRYDLQIADLFADTVNWSPGWSRWDPVAPNLAELFDFGTDGTTDGQPDGSVPVTAPQSDADLEGFFTALWNEELSIVYLKQLGSPGDLPYRWIQVLVRLRDGDTAAWIEHHEVGGEFWSGSARFTRPPRLLVPNITEFSVSTALSNPFDPATNPTGVTEEESVRVTIVTSQDDNDRGGQVWANRISSCQIAPRN
jgi:prepilin-type N-terminal cleavage/methylation domain-containing protein